MPRFRPFCAIQKFIIFLVSFSLLADEQRDVALNAEATAQAERDRADEAAALSFSRELAVQAKLNLTVDPERSILLALAALDQAFTQEAENVLHEAVLASRLRLTLRGHEGSIEDMTYSPDGRLIATASLDNTARLWDVTTGKELLRLQHPAGVGHVAFTSEVKFWDPVSGDELFMLSDPGWLSVAPGVDLVANEITFSPDGTRLAISLGSGETGLGRIEVWDVATRQKVQTMAGQFRFDPFLPISFSPDGTRLVATRGPDDRTTIWDVASGNLLFT